MSLRDKLKALEELQQIDLESDEVRKALGTVPARRAAAEQKILEARKAYDEQKARLDQNERERRQIDVLLSMERDKVKKWEGRLGEIKTPREYAALSREIDIAKKSNETQSQLSKDLVNAAADLAKALEAASEALADAEEATEADRTALAAEQKALEEKLASLQARRGGAATQIGRAHV